MLPKTFQLKVNTANKFTRSNKKEAYTPLFKIVYRLKASNDPPKIGFIVAGRVGKAAKRNRVRRLLSEAVRTKIAAFPKGIEAIIIANKSATEANYEQIFAVLSKALSKIHLPAS